MCTGRGRTFRGPGRQECRSTATLKPGGLVKTQAAGPRPRDADSAGLERDLGISLSGKCPVAAGTPGTLRTMGLEESG